MKGCAARNCCCSGDCSSPRSAAAAVAVSARSVAAPAGPAPDMVDGTRGRSGDRRGHHRFGHVRRAGARAGDDPDRRRSEVRGRERRRQTERASESIVVGNGQALQNVFVYVKDGLGKYAFPIPAEPVVLDQQKCRYAPHVLGVRVGQRLSIHNSDPLLHNVRVEGQVNRPFNMSTPLQGVSFDKTFATREVMVPVRCDVHNWMSAFIGAMDHPFFGVTGADGRVALDRPAARHLHDRSVARDSSGRRPSRSPSARKNRRMSASPSHADTGARAAAGRDRGHAVARGRLRHADEAAPELPRPVDHRGRVLARQPARRACSPISCTRSPAPSWSPPGPPRSTKCGNERPIA